MDKYVILSPKQYELVDYKSDPFYASYKIFIQGKPLSDLEFSGLMRCVLGSNMYKYYINLPYFYYVVYYCLSELNNKKIRKGFKYGLTDKGVLFLSLKIYCFYIETCEVDTKERSFLCKRRVYNKLISYLKNKFFPFEIFIKDVSSTELKEEAFIDFLQELIITIDLKFLTLGLCKPVIDYGMTIGVKISQNIFIPEELNNHIEVNDLVDENTVGQLIFSQKEEKAFSNMVLQVKKSQKKFSKRGSRLLMLSKEVFIIRGVFNSFSDVPPYYDDKVFIHNGTVYPKFIYNSCNPEETSKGVLNILAALNMSINEIGFKSSLFFSIDWLFKLKHSEFNQKWDKLNLISIYEELQLKAKVSPVVSSFFPHSFDFRGRIYMQTNMSLTSNKLLRYIVTLQSNTKELNDKAERLKDFYRKQLYLLDPYTNYLENYLKTEESKIIFLIGIFNIGKVFKTSLLKISEIKGGVSLNLFLKKGLDVFFYTGDDFKTKFELDDIDDLAAVLTMIKKLKEYLTDGTNFCVLIDSTASGIMHLNSWIKLNKSYWQYINLGDSDVWYDTYSFFLEKTFSKFQKRFESVDENFTTPKKTTKKGKKQLENLINMQSQSKDELQAILTKKLKEREELHLKQSALMGEIRNQKATLSLKKKTLLKQFNLKFTPFILTEANLDFGEPRLTDNNSEVKESLNFQKFKKTLNELKEKKHDALVFIKELKLLSLNLKSKIFEKNILQKRTLTEISKEINSLEKIVAEDIKKDRIEEFGVEKTIEMYKPLFTRSRIKKVFMTLPYNATNFTLLEYFSEGMTREEKLIVTNNISKPFITSIREVFLELHEKKFEEIIKNPIFNNSYIFSFFNNNYDFTYYYMELDNDEKTIKKDRNYFSRYVLAKEHPKDKKIRLKLEKNKTVEEKQFDREKRQKENKGTEKKYFINEEKTQIAFTANVMHMTDALFLSLVYDSCYNRGVQIRTIHDEFILPVNNYFFVLAEMNDCYAKIYNEVNGEDINLTSLFIAL